MLARFLNVLDSSISLDLTEALFCARSCCSRSRIAELLTSTSVSTSYDSASLEAETDPSIPDTALGLTALALLFNRVASCIESYQNKAVTSSSFEKGAAVRWIRFSCSVFKASLPVVSGGKGASIPAATVASTALDVIERSLCAGSTTNLEHDALVGALVDAISLEPVIINSSSIPDDDSVTVMWLLKVRTLNVLCKVLGNNSNSGVQHPGIPGARAGSSVSALLEKIVLSILDACSASKNAPMLLKPAYASAAIYALAAICQCSTGLFRSCLPALSLLSSQQTSEALCVALEQLLLPCCSDCPPLVRVVPDTIDETNANIWLAQVIRDLTERTIALSPASTSRTAVTLVLGDAHPTAVTGQGWDSRVDDSVAADSRTSKIDNAVDELPLLARDFLCPIDTRLSLVCHAIVNAAATADECQQPASSWSPIAVALMVGVSSACLSQHTIIEDVQRGRLSSHFFLGLFKVCGLRGVSAFTLLAQPETSSHGPTRQRFRGIWHDALMKCLATLAEFEFDYTISTTVGGRIFATCRNVAACMMLAESARLIELCCCVAEAALAAVEMPGDPCAVGYQHVIQAIMCALTSCSYSVMHSDVAVWLCSNALSRIANHRALGAATALLNVRGAPSLLALLGVLHERLIFLSDDVPHDRKPDMLHRSGVISPPQWLLPTCPWLEETVEVDASCMNLRDEYFSGLGVTAQSISKARTSAPATTSDGITHSQSRHSLQGRCKAVIRSALLGVLHTIFVVFGQARPESDAHRAVLLCAMSAPLTDGEALASSNVVAPSSKPTLFRTCGIHFGTRSPLEALFKVLEIDALRETAACIIVQLALTTERLIDAGQNSAFEALALTLTYAHRSPTAPTNDRTAAWASAAVGLFSAENVFGRDSRGLTGARWLFHVVRTTMPCRSEVLGGLSLELPWGLGLRDAMTVLVDAEAVRTTAIEIQNPSRSLLLASLPVLVRQGHHHVAAAFRQSVVNTLALLRNETWPTYAVALLRVFQYMAVQATRILLSPPCAAPAPLATAPIAALFAWIADCDRLRADRQRWLQGVEGSREGSSFIRSIIGMIEVVVATAYKFKCYHLALRAFAAGVDVLSALTSGSLHVTSLARAGLNRRLAFCAFQLFRLSDAASSDVYDSDAIEVVMSLTRYASTDLLFYQAPPFSIEGVRLLHRLPPLCPIVTHPDIAVSLFAVLSVAPESAQEVGLRCMLQMLEWFLNSRSAMQHLPSTPAMLQADAIRNVKLLSLTSSCLDAAIALANHVPLRLKSSLLDIITLMLPFACSPSSVRQLTWSLNCAGAAGDPFPFGVLERLVRLAVRACNSDPLWLAPRADADGEQHTHQCEVPDYCGPTPRHFFVLSTEMSGLRLVTQRADGSFISGLAQWPGSGRSGPISEKSFSFHCWVCIRDDGHALISSRGITPSVAPPDTDAITPSLLFVADEGGRSLSFGFRLTRKADGPLGDDSNGRQRTGYVLQLRVKHQKREAETLEASSCTVLPNRWYSVGFAHVKPAASLLSRGLSSFGVHISSHHATARIFINGQCVGQGNLGYPNFGTNVDTSPGPQALQPAFSPNAQSILPSVSAPGASPWGAVQVTYLGTRNSSAVSGSCVGGVQCVIGTANASTNLSHVGNVNLLPTPTPRGSSHACRCLHGSLAGILLFDAALTSEHMSRLFAAGPSAAVSFADALSFARVSTANMYTDESNRAHGHAVASTSPSLASLLFAAFDPTVRVHRPASSATKEQRALYTSLIPRSISSQHPIISAHVAQRAVDPEASWFDASDASNPVQAGTSAVIQGATLFLEALPGTSTVFGSPLQSLIIPHVDDLLGVVLLALSQMPSPVLSQQLPSVCSSLALLLSKYASPAQLKADDACDDRTLRHFLSTESGGRVLLLECFRRIPAEFLDAGCLSSIAHWIGLDDLHIYQSDASEDTFRRVITSKLGRARSSSSRSVEETELKVVKVLLCDKATWCRPGVSGSILLQHARVLLGCAFASDDYCLLFRETLGFSFFLSMLADDYVTWRTFIDDTSSDCYLYDQARQTIWSLLRYILTKDPSFCFHRSVTSTLPNWAKANCTPLLATSELLILLETYAFGRAETVLSHPCRATPSKFASGAHVNVSASTAGKRHADISLLDLHVAEAVHFLVDFLRVPNCGKRIYEQLLSNLLSEHIRCRTDLDSQTLEPHFIHIASQMNAFYSSNDFGSPTLPEAESASERSPCRLLGHASHSSEVNDVVQDETAALEHVAKLARSVACNATLYSGADLLFRLLMSPLPTLHLAALEAILELLHLGSKGSVCGGVNFAALGTVVLHDASTIDSANGVTLCPANMSYTFGTGATIRSLQSLQPSFSFVEQCLKGNPFFLGTQDSLRGSPQPSDVPGAIITAFNAHAAPTALVSADGHKCSELFEEDGSDSASVQGKSAPLSSTIRSARSGRPPIRPPIATSSVRYGRVKKPPPSQVSPDVLPSASGDSHRRTYDSASIETHTNLRDTLSAETLTSITQNRHARLLDNGSAAQFLNFMNISKRARATSVMSSVSTKDDKPVSSSANARAPRCLFSAAPTVGAILSACAHFSSAALQRGLKPELLLNALLAAIFRNFSDSLLDSQSPSNPLSLVNHAFVPLLVSTLIHCDVSQRNKVLRSLLAALGTGDAASGVVHDFRHAPLQWIIPILRLACDCYERAAACVTEETTLQWEACACSAVRVLSSLHVADIRRRPRGDDERAYNSKPDRSATWSLAGLRNLLSSLLLLQSATSDHESNGGERMILPLVYRALAISQLLCGVLVGVKLVDSVETHSAHVQSPRTPMPPTPTVRLDVDRHTRMPSLAERDLRFPVSDQAKTEECRRALFEGCEEPFHTSGHFPSNGSASSSLMLMSSADAPEHLTAGQGLWLLGLLLVDEATTLSRMDSSDALSRSRQTGEAVNFFWGAVLLWLQLGIVSGVGTSVGLSNSTPAFVPCEPHERILGGSARLAVALIMRALLLGAVGHCAAPVDADVVDLVAALGAWSLFSAGSSSADASSACAHPIQRLLACGLIGTVAIATPHGSGHLRALWLSSIIAAVAPRIIQAGASIATQLVACADVAVSYEGSPSASDYAQSSAVTALSADDSLRLQLITRLLGSAGASQLARHLPAVLSICQVLFINEPSYNRVVGRVRELYSESPSVIGTDSSLARNASVESTGRPQSRRFLATSSLASANLTGLRSTEEASRVLKRALLAELHVQHANVEHLSWTSLAFGMCVAGTASKARDIASKRASDDQMETSRLAERIVVEAQRPGSALACPHSLDVARFMDSSFRAGRQCGSPAWQHRPSSNFIAVHEDTCGDTRGVRWRLAWIPRDIERSAVTLTPQGAQLVPHNWKPSLWMLDGSTDGAAIKAHYEMRDEIAASDFVSRRASTVADGPSMSVARAAAANAAVAKLSLLQSPPDVVYRRERCSGSVLSLVDDIGGSAASDDGPVCEDLPALRPSTRRPSIVTSIASSQNHQNVALPFIAATITTAESVPIDNVHVAGVAPVAAPLVLQLPCVSVTPLLTTAGRFIILRDSIVFLRDHEEDPAVTASLGVAGIPPLHAPPARAPSRDDGDCNASLVSTRFAQDDPSSPSGQRRRLCASLLRQTPSARFPLVGLASMENRRFRCEHVALEFFFVGGRALLFAFDSREARDAVAHAVLLQHTPQLAPYLSRARLSRAAARELASRWRQRQVSNFDYLMGLNRLAGRTYNDLSQYPIMPWVLSNYTAPTLDLNDPSNYRDLAYPIGAQTPERRRALRAQYNEADSNYRERLAQEAAAASASAQAAEGGAPGSADLLDGPPWHFGSFYLGPATVAWYLLRLEPMQSYHLVLMDGRFDRPDRQFHSVASAFRSATTHESDIKELTPEWYSTPDFLRNAAHGTELGTRQSGEVLDDVCLPPWAATPEDFIRINRAALESDAVSARLHLWVDLVFGHKQRGPHLPGGSLCAVAACNVFHGFMYEGGVRLGSLRGPARRGLLQFIDSVGCAPPVLFTLAPARAPTLALRLGRGDTAGGGADDFAAHARALEAHAQAHEHDALALEDSPGNDPSTDLNPANGPRQPAPPPAHACTQPLFSRLVEWCSSCCGKAAGSRGAEDAGGGGGGEADDCRSGVHPWPQQVPATAAVAAQAPAAAQGPSSGNRARIKSSGGASVSGARPSMGSVSYRRSRGSSSGAPRTSGVDLEDSLASAALAATATPPLRGGRGPQQPRHAMGPPAGVVLQPHSLPVLLISLLAGSGAAAEAAGGEHGTALLLTVDAGREAGLHVWGRSHGRHTLLLDPRTPGGAATLARLVSQGGGGGKRSAASAAAGDGHASPLPIAAARHGGGADHATAAGLAHAQAALHAGVAFAPEVFHEVPHNPWALGGGAEVCASAGPSALAAPGSAAALPPLLQGALFAVSPCGAYLLSGGHWDGSLTVTHLATGRLVQSLLPAGGGSAARTVVTAVTVARALPAAVAVGAAALMRTAERADAPEPLLRGPAPGALNRDPSAAGGGDSGGGGGSSSGGAGGPGAFDAHPSWASPGVSGALCPDAIVRHIKRVARQQQQAPAAAAAHPDGGARVIVGAADGSIRAFAWIGPPQGGRARGGAEVISPVILAQARAQSAAITSLSCAPATDTLVAGSLDGSAVVCALRSLAVRFSIPPPPAAVCGCDPPPASVHAAATAAAMKANSAAAAVPATAGAVPVDSVATPATPAAAAAPAGPDTLGSPDLRSASRSTAGGDSGVRLRLGVGGRPLPASAGSEWPPYAPPCARPLAHGVTWAGTSIARHVLVYRRAGSTLESHSANGVEQCPPLRLPFVALAFAWSLDGERILVGGTGPLIVVLEASSLTVAQYIGVNGACACPSHRPPAAAPPSGTGSVRFGGGSPQSHHPEALSPLPPPLSLGPSASGGFDRPAGGTPGSPHPSSPPSLLLSRPAPMPRDPRLPRPNASLVRFPHAVTSLGVTEHEQALFVGLQSGELRCFTGRELLLTARTLHDMSAELGF